MKSLEEIRLITRIRMKLAAAWALFCIGAFLAVIVLGVRAFWRWA